MKTRILIFIFTVFTAFAVLSATKQPEPFSSAADFPREGALIYIQVEDLPVLINLWNESSFKEKYAQSASFKDFQNRHLGRKLLSRWREFSDAAGFPVDLETVANLSQNKAALVLYDIGKLEFVFIAPMSEEVFAASKFAIGRDKFAEQMLGNGTTIYRAKVAADRGRQNQELIFCYASGRFILATSEKLMAQTLQNIGGSSTKNRLFDAPLFSALKDRIEPHLATVWVNQTALNEDYYFKRYWLMTKIEKLNNIRAGIFDVEIAEDKIVENRKFLLAQATEGHESGKAGATALLNIVPEKMPFYRLQAVTEENTNKAIQNAIFESQKFRDNQQNNFINKFSFNNTDYYELSDYQSLSYKFDDTIDDTEDEKLKNSLPLAGEINFFEILRSAQPQSVLTIARPRVLSTPMFLEFNRAVAFYLAAPKNFHRERFEKEIIEKFAAQTTVVKSEVNIMWETQNTANSEAHRRLSLPMLGIQVSYVLQDNILILANDDSFLDEIVTVSPSKTEDFDGKFYNLAVINLEEKSAAYDEVINTLAKKNAANDFLDKNVKSFVNLITDVKQIEIKEKYHENLMEVTLTCFR